MDGLIRASLLALVLGLTPGQDCLPWERLEALTHWPTSDALRRVELDDLSVMAVGNSAEAKVFRARLGALGGPAAPLELSADEVLGLGPEMAWGALEACPNPGTGGRPELLARSLGSGDADLGPRLRMAYEELVFLADQLELPRALPLAEACYQAAPAAWSAINCAQTLNRLGRGPDAQALIAAELDRQGASGEPLERAALFEELGILTLAARRPAEARGYLGRAFALGDKNAAVVLGSHALHSGQPAVARALFAGQLDHRSTPPWALRGWGLALLAE